MHVEKGEVDTHCDSIAIQDLPEIAIGNFMVFGVNQVRKMPPDEHLRRHPGPSFAGLVHK